MWELFFNFRIFYCPSKAYSKKHFDPTCKTIDCTLFDVCFVSVWWAGVKVFATWTYWNYSQFSSDHGVSDRSVHGATSRQVIQQKLDLLSKSCLLIEVSLDPPTGMSALLFFFSISLTVPADKPQPSPLTVTALSFVTNCLSNGFSTKWEKYWAVLHGLSMIQSRVQVFWVWISYDSNIDLGSHTMDGLSQDWLVPIKTLHKAAVVRKEKNLFVVLQLLLWLGYWGMAI